MQLPHVSQRPYLLMFAIVLLALAVFLALDRPREAGGQYSGSRFEQVDQYIRDELSGSRIPGVSVAIVEGGETVHATGFGTDGRGNEVTAQTPFWIGSLTKSFTALGVMQLVEAGKVDLDAPVQRYVPGFRVASEADSQQITVRHLLNQTSGFSRETGITPLLEEKVQTLDEAVADLATVKLNRPVGETYEYSNANFVVLGLVVERVSGEKWTAYIQRHIFDPLGMTGSYTDFATAKANGMTALHSTWFGFPVETEPKYLPGLAPEGYLVASAEDMARYLAMYLRGGELDGVRVLSREGIAEMLRANTNEASRMLLSTTFDFQYGMGWFVGPFGGAENARWHLGQMPFLNAWMVLMPERETAVVVLMNSGSQLEIANANEVMSRLPIGVVNILEGEDPPSGIGMSRFYLYFDAAVLVIAGLLAWSLVRVVSSKRQLAGVRGPRRALRTLRDGGPLLWEVGLSLYILAQLPGSMGMSWEGSFRSIPDLTLVVLMVALLWLATGLARIARLTEAPLRSLLRRNEGATPTSGGLRLGPG